MTETNKPYVQTTIKIPIHIYEEARRLSYLKRVSMKDQFHNAWCEFTDDGNRTSVWDEAVRAGKEKKHQNTMVTLTIRIPKWLHQEMRDIKKTHGISVSEQFLIAWLDKYNLPEKE